MRPRACNYTLDYRPESKTLLFFFNAIDDQGEESLAEFAVRLDETAQRHEIERFVMDLRANQGANNELAQPLIDMISGHPVLDRRGVLHVILGRRTFSAAANFACSLERRTRAIFVGETSGFAPNHLGDPVSVLLPGSKVVVRLASRDWREDLPGVDRSALEPDIPVGFTSRDHFERRDPALLAIASHRPDALPDTGERPPPEALGTYLLSPHHRVRLLASEGKDRLEIDGVGPYAITDLHAEGEGVFQTDINGMTLEAPAEGAVSLRWYGAVFRLARVAGEHRLPFELLQDGEVPAGVEACRSADGDWPLGADVELGINRLAYEALGTGRTGDAVLMFRLNTELFPGSANTWDGLGDGLRARGDVEAAAQAYRHALERNAIFGPSQRSLVELGVALDAE